VYRSEAAFSKAFCGRLKRLGCFVTRIESGTTRVGIPDIYAVLHGQEYWFELKNIRKHYHHGPLYIPWRPGQQAWAYEYLQAKGRPSYTIVSCINCFLIVSHVKHFENSMIREGDFIKIQSLKEFTI